MADLKINDPSVGQFVMPWADLSKPPSSAEIDDYIEKQVKPKRLKTNTTPEADSLWNRANKPILPDVTVPGTNKAGQTLEEADFRQQHPYQSLAGDTIREFAQGAYDKLIQPASSAVGIGITGATTLAGVPELAKYAKPIARVGLGALAAKGATEIPEAYKQYKVNPNIDTGQNLALSVASPLAMGAGVVELGRGVPKVKNGEPASVVPKPKPEPIPEPQSTEIAIPKGVTVKLNPGYEDVLFEDPKTKQVIIKNVEGFKKGVGDIKGPDAKVKQLANDLKAAQPSRDYNQNYNPDAVVQSNINGPADVKNSFADWVNGRASAKWTGKNIGEAFSQLDEKYGNANPVQSHPGDFKATLGDDGEASKVAEKPQHPLVRLQEAIANGEEPEVERYMNQLHEEIKKAGSSGRQLDLGYKEDYLPQMWQNPIEEVTDAFKETKRLGIKPSFGMGAVFKDYQHGIDSGLTPKFNNPSELMASYASYVDKFVADKNFFDQLKENGQLKTRAQVAGDWKNWEALDPKRTPVQRFVTSEPLKGEGETNITREYYVPKDLAANINDYLRGTDKESTWGKIKQTGGQLKSLAMTSGIPGTGLNIHGINVGVGRMWQAGGAKMVGHYLKYALDPEAASSFTRNNLYDAPRFVKAGLQFSPDFGAKTGAEGVVGKSLQAKHNLLERPIFGQVLPALQLELAQMVEKGYLERGIDQKLATKLAVHDANNFVSNLNYDEIMRDKTTRNLVSAISFAPQWLESHYNLAKGSAQALLNPKDPKGYLYRQATGQLVKAYLATGLINKATSGTFDPFELHLGKDKDSGKDISIPLLGSGDDWLKIIPQIAQAAMEGKPFSKISDLTKGRLATPAQFAVDFLSKQKAQGGDLYRDSKGDLPIVVPDNKRNSQVGNIAELGARTLAPRWIPSTIDLARGKGSLGRVAADASGFQVRERAVPKVKAAF